MRDTRVHPRGDLLPQDPPIDSVDWSDDFMEAETCGACALRGRCYWVRMLYARLCGIGEMQPMAGGRRRRAGRGLG